MKAWEEFLTQLEEELGPDVVNRWLRPLKIKSFDAGNVYLEAQDYFQALWFDEHIRNRAKKALQTVSGQPVKIHINVGTDSPNPIKRGSSSPKKRLIGSENFAQHFSIQFDSLDPYASYDTFVINEANFVPLKLLSELVGYDPQSKLESTPKQQLGTFNPIYLYGKEGAGKTHLLVATTKMLKNKGREVLYVRAPTFTEHVVNAIRAGEMSQFRETYRKTDVLIIDDVHLFSRKGATQEELFHTFNTLHLAGRQIILSSNCSPQELQMIEPRLVSRFEWGIAIPMDPIGKKELDQILEIKTHLMSFPLSGKVKEYLLETFATPKAITKALEALVLRFHMKDQSAHFSSTTLTVPTVRHSLSDILEEQMESAITADKIIQKTADYFGIPIEDILGKSQSRECVFPRQVVMFLCRKVLEMPFIKIGDLFGKDHSTVMSSIKRIEQQFEQGDKEVISAVKLVEQKC